MYKKEKNLCEFRIEIDAIDTAIMALLEKRLSVVNEVSEYKKLHDLSPLDTKREEQIICKAKSPEVKEIYEKVIEVSRNRVIEKCCQK